MVRSQERQVLLETSRETHQKLANSVQPPRDRPLLRPTRRRTHPVRLGLLHDLSPCAVVRWVSARQVFAWTIHGCPCGPGGKVPPKRVLRPNCQNPHNSKTTRRFEVCRRTDPTTLALRAPARRLLRLRLRVRPVQTNFTFQTQHAEQHDQCPSFDGSHLIAECRQTRLETAAQAWPKRFVACDAPRHAPAVGSHLAACDVDRRYPFPPFRN